MRLYTCHVENFGGLHDLDLDFREKLHTVREDNGWGKSTLAAFLLIMFYGFANEKSRSEISNERRRYAPWQQGIYGGSVTFSWKGRMLRLERVFGLKNAGEDTAAVYDADTNLPAGDFPDDPGEMLFSIDRESFARTVFIAQQDCGTEATSGIQAKIGHLEGEAADMADYHQVQASLKKMADGMNPGRKTGEIYRIRQKLAGLESDVSRRPVYEHTLERLEGQLAGRTQEQQRLRSEAETVQGELRQLAVMKRSAEDFALDGEEEQRLARLEEVFSSGMPDQQQMEEAETCLSEIRKMRSAFDREQDELYSPGGDARAEQPARSGTSLISVLVFTLFAAALLAFFLNKAVAAALAVLAVVVMIVVIRRDMQKEKEEGPKKPVVAVKRKTSPLDKVTDIRARREKLKELWNEIQAAETELQEFLQQFYPELTEEEDYSRKLQQLQYEQAEYTALLKKKARSAEAEAAWQESAVRAGAVLGGMTEREAASLSVDDLEQLIAENRAKTAGAESEIENIRRQIETVREELDHAAEAEEQLASVREELSGKLHTYEILTQTREYLARARTAFTARYMEPVQDAFDRYYRQLTGSEAKEYQLDADLKIEVREYGLLRDTAFLSEGWQDVIGLCRRMAMIDVMYEGEKPFLLLDDPFVNLDGEKLHRALAFLEQIAEKYQVIYFTCHESRVPASSK